MADTPKKILVVDDKPDIVETVSLCLTQEGFQVSTAYDGEQALEVARREQPDLIVLDVMLPKENGYQVARYLREDFKEGRLSSLPHVLLLTARTVSDKQREDFLRTWSGAEEVIYKPFDLEALIERVRSLLRSENGAAASAES